MRQLYSHKVNGLKEALTILAMDEPGPGHSCHKYRTEYAENGLACCSQEVKFQEGPILESGVNGTSNEALLAIVEDRLLGFQSGPFACRENAIALTKIQEAMMWLQKRTMDRMRRGVEGTNQK